MPRFEFTAETKRSKIFAAAGGAIIIGSFVLAALLFLPPPAELEAATPGTVSYTYDSLGRVITDANSTGNSGSYTYDKVGNRTAARLN